MIEYYNNFAWTGDPNRNSKQQREAQRKNQQRAQAQAQVQAQAQPTAEQKKPLRRDGKAAALPLWPQYTWRGGAVPLPGDDVAMRFSIDENGAAVAAQAANVRKKVLTEYNIRIPPCVDSLSNPCC